MLRSSGAPRAKRDRSTSAAATAVDLLFHIAARIAIPAIVAMTQPATPLCEPGPLRQSLVQLFGKPQQRDAIIAAVMPDA